MVKKGKMYAFVSKILSLKILFKYKLLICIIKKHICLYVIKRSRNRYTRLYVLTNGQHISLVYELKAIKLR